MRPGASELVASRDAGCTDVRFHANNGLFVARRPPLAHFGDIGVISIARRDGIDSGGFEAPGRCGGSSVCIDSAPKRDGKGGQ